MVKIIEFFKQYGVEANYTFTFLFTLFVFFLGVFSQGTARWLSAGRTRRLYRKSLIFILEDFSRACEKQSQTVSASLENTGFMSGKSWIVSFIQIGVLDYLSKLDWDNFIRNFGSSRCKGDASKAISKLISTVADIKYFNEDVSKFTSTMFSAYQPQEKTFQDSVNELRKIHDTMRGGFSAGQRPSAQSLEAGVFDIFEAWIKDGGKTEMQVVYRELVVKLKELSRRHVSNDPARQIMELSLEAETAYINIENIDTMLHKRFLDFSHVHRRTSRIINMIVKILK